MNFRYLQYFIFRNREYDYNFLLEIIEKKLTTMGMYFARHGIAVFEERKEIVKGIWQARRYLRNSIHGDEILGKKADNAIFNKYNRHYELKIINQNERIGTDSIEIVVSGFLPEEQHEVKQLYESIGGAEIVSEYQRSELEKAFDIIAENIFGWWD